MTLYGAILLLKVMVTGMTFSLLMITKNTSNVDNMNEVCDTK